VGVVVEGQLTTSGAAHHVLVRGPELAEVHGLAALDGGDHEGTAPVRLGQVDRDAQVHPGRLDQDRLAVDLGVRAVHLGVLGQRLDQRVPDDVGEADLAAATAGEVVVDHDPVVRDQLRRHRPYARGGRYRQRALHVLYDAGGDPAQRHGRRAGRYRG